MFVCLQGSPSGKGSSTRGRQTRLGTQGGSPAVKRNILDGGATAKQGNNITPKKGASATGKKAQGRSYTQSQKNGNIVKVAFLLAKSVYQNRILVKVGQNWSDLVKKGRWSQCLK